MGGAVEKMWFILGQKFSARGHEVTHISKRWKNLPDEELIQDVKHVRVLGYNTPSNLFFLKLLDAFYTLRTIKAISNDTDIIITNTFWAPIFFPIIMRGKVYVDVARMPKGQMRFYKKAHFRANSTSVAKAIQDELPLNCHHRISIVPNPLPYEVKSSDLSELNNKSRYILFCGRIHPEKGLNLLVETVNALPNGWTVKIVGPWKTDEGGGGAAYLHSLKNLFNNESKVQFIEPIYDINELNILYKEASIFVYPSIAEKGETFGLAPLEAMAWSAVPVVSDIECFKDFVSHEKNGLTFDHRAGNASEQLMHCILSLIKDPEKLIRLGKEAFKVNVSHSPDIIADYFLEDFEKILS